MDRIEIQLNTKEKTREKFVCVCVIK